MSDYNALPDASVCPLPPYASASGKTSATRDFVGYPVDDDLTSSEPNASWYPHHSTEKGYPKNATNVQMVQQSRQMNARPVEPDAMILVPTDQFDDYLPPDDCLCYSIFVTVCCCWLIGIFAIISSTECRVANAVGNRAVAKQKSGVARNYAHAALGVGLCGIIVCVIYVFMQMAYLQKSVYP